MSPLQLVAPSSLAGTPAPAPCAFLGNSPAARTIARMLPRLAECDTSALIQGETGVGKTFLARAIHDRSARAGEPFHAVDCGSIPEGLVESTLFGHERGAFTGASATQPGAVEAAGAGTLFLDEIGELPLASQAKLLQALGERRFTRVGSTRSIPIGARVLAATNRDLEAMVKEGRFRADLFYRLAVVELHVPPLRERADDLVKLARHVLGELGRERGRGTARLAPDAVASIRRYDWPGNVRELKNALEHALVAGDGATIEAHDLPARVRSDAGQTAPHPPGVMQLPCALAAGERTMLRAALDAAGGNVARAARILGVDRQTVYNRVKALEMDAASPPRPAGTFSTSRSYLGRSR